MLTNSIHSNASLGIDLSPSGVTANNDDTAASEQARPNRGRNFPVLTSAVRSGSSIVINGTLDSLPSTPFLIEFFDNDVIDAAAGGDNSHGEGKTYIGSTVVTTNASGDATFAVTLAVSVAAGHFITATSTNDLNTSEFSRAVVVCGYALSSAPESQLFSSRGGNGKVGITTQGVCGWTAVSNVTWIVITSATSGTGNESITFEVRENFTAAVRTGTLTVAGQSFTVMQDKPGTTACAYTVSPLSQTVAAAGGTATATVTTAAGCGVECKGGRELDNHHLGQRGHRQRQRDVLCHGQHGPGRPERDDHHRGQEDKREATSPLKCHATEIQSSLFFYSLCLCGKRGS